MTKESPEKNIDVAISFLSSDEKIVKNLFDQLNERMDVFYYPDRQPELVGTDGEETFSEVFRDKARVVVIFYREEWGKTPMTRAEKSGIKQRAFEEGYNFSIWVPLDEDKSVPAYLDPQFIWYDFHRWGVEGLCAVIEEKVKKSGIKVRPKTKLDELQQINKNIELEDARYNFERSEKGLEFVQDSKAKIEQIIKQRVNKYRDITENVRFKIDNSSNGFRVKSSRYRIVIYVLGETTNWINNVKLTIDIQKDKNKRYPPSNFSNLKTFIFKPTLETLNEPGWKSNNQFCSIAGALHKSLDYFAELCFKEVASKKKNQ